MKCSTNNSSKKETASVNFSVNGPNKCSHFAFGDKTVLKTSASKDIYSHHDDELCNIPTIHAEKAPKSVSEYYLETSDETFANVNDSFSEKSDLSFNFQLSLTTVSDDMKTTNIFRDSVLVHQSMTSAPDLKFIDDQWTPVPDLPPLETLPMTHIETSYRSSVLSISSLNESMEFTEEECAATDSQKLSPSECFTETELCLDISSDQSRSNKLANMTENFTKSGQKFTMKSQFGSSNQKTHPLNDKSCPLRSLSSENTAIPIPINETKSIDNMSNSSSISENNHEHTMSMKNNLNVNNVLYPETNLKPDGLEKRPPLYPRRRSYSHSTSTPSEVKVTDTRTSTPPASYQRNELLPNREETFQSTEEIVDSTKIGFPYPCLDRFPPPRSKSEATNEYMKQEEIHGMETFRIKENENTETCEDNQIRAEYDPISESQETKRKVSLGSNFSDFVERSILCCILL